MVCGIRLQPDMSASAGRQYNVPEMPTHGVSARRIRTTMAIVAALVAWPLARAPYLLQTSIPGIFAVGDVRSGSVKRVASAVGEGSVSIPLVHRVLAE